MGMIELIFSIVIIGVTLLSIPAMMTVMNRSSQLALNDEVYGKIYAMAQRKALNPWDKSVMDGLAASEIGTIARIAGDTGSLRCGRMDGNSSYRLVPYSMRQCNENTSRSVSMPITPLTGDGNGSKGIEAFNNVVENLTLTSGTQDLNYTIKYSVDYVNDSATQDLIDPSRMRAQWSVKAANAGSVTHAQSHLKRISITYSSPLSNTPSVYTFFMSNIGVVQ